MKKEMAFRDLPNGQPAERGDGLAARRDELNRPDLTAEQALWLLEETIVTRRQEEAARLRYTPGEPSLSQAQIALRQHCTRGPIVYQLARWREEARKLLEECGG